MKNSEQNLPSFAVAFFVWGWGAMFYLLGFFHRVSPAVITNELMLEFNISASGLGNLSAFYFYTYVAMQIPTGILTDRVGPRRLLLGGAFVAAAGAFLFSLSPDYFWAGAGRLLIGGSVAVAFVSLLKIAANWFNPNRFALLSGIALLFGIIGAVGAGPPLRLMVDAFGWRNSMLISALATVAVGFAILLFVRDNPSDKGYKNFCTPTTTSPSSTKRSILKDILEVFSYRNSMLLFFIPGGVVGCILTFTGLWGVPYLTTLHNISAAQAATITSIMLIAWALGGPFFGWLSDRLKNRKTPYIWGCAISLVGWIILILYRDLSFAASAVLLLIIGFSSGSMIITFAYAKESVPLYLAGTVSGIVNMGVMMGPMILQPAVGFVLDSMWGGEIVDGIRFYSLHAYQFGFSLMLGWLLFSLVLLFLTQETKCRQLSQ